MYFSLTTFTSFISFLYFCFCERGCDQDTKLPGKVNTQQNKMWIEKLKIETTEVKLEMRNLFRYIKFEKVFVQLETTKA